MSNKKVIQINQVDKLIFKYVFEDLSYFTFNFVTFERWCYNDRDRPHREDGPAVEYADGSKQWYKNGLLHREDGPAVVFVDGGQDWYRNGLLHREDGPAVEYADGSKRWYLDGEYYTEKLWKAELKRRSKINNV